MIGQAPLEGLTDAEIRRKAEWLELCRRRLLPFFKHVFTGQLKILPETIVIAEALERFFQKVREGGRPRLIIIEPPRVGKSELTTRTFPAWVLGQEPDWHLGIVSYGDDLAWEMSSDCRAIVNDEAFAEIWGATYKTEDELDEVIALDPNTKSVKHWKIKDRRGGVRSAGINGSLTGKGYKIVVFDDPTKGRKEADSRDYRDEQWAQFKGTFYPRLEPEGSGIVVMGTAWHVDDILGRLQKENLERENDLLADHWEILHIPAQALPGRKDILGRSTGEWMGGRRTIPEWEHLKANIDPREWAAQYLGLPLPEEGQIFHPYEDFLFEEAPEDEPGKLYRGPRYGFADTSHAKNRDSDYSAIGICQIEPDRLVDLKNYHVLGILDAHRARWQYPELKQQAKRAYDFWKLWAFVIEDYSSGRALAQEFKMDSGMSIVTYRPDRDKFARAHAATETMSRWKIRVPEGDRFPSGLLIRVFLDELASFQPGGVDHDDQVDWFTMAMRGVSRWYGAREIQMRDFVFV